MNINYGHAQLREWVEKQAKDTRRKKIKKILAEEEQEEKDRIPENVDE